MLETLIRDKLVKYLEENNFLRDTQHGFQNICSCLTNLLDNIFHDYNKSSVVDIFYLDFRQSPPPASNSQTESTQNLRRHSDMNRKLAEEQETAHRINCKVIKLNWCHKWSASRVSSRISSIFSSHKRYQRWTFKYNIKVCG